MTHETLKLAVQHLIETQVITPDRFNAVYQWVQKRLLKKAVVNSVTYELSDTQKIIVSCDTTTYYYSVEIIDSKPQPVIVQPTVPEAVLVDAVPLQLSLFDNLPVDADKALQYFRTHKKARRLKLVVDNAPSPQLPLNFDTLCTHAGNVISLCQVRQKRQPKLQQYDWGWQYLIDAKGF